MFYWAYLVLKELVLNYNVLQEQMLVFEEFKKWYKNSKKMQW